MLVLFETPAGYALFKALDKGKLKNVDDIHKEFSSPDAASKMVKLKAFEKFGDTQSALGAATAICDGKLDKTLKKFLKAQMGEDGKDKLAVMDVKLGNLIKEKMGVKCVWDSGVSELMRGIRSQMDSLLSGLPEQDLKAMKLGLSHSLGRYKLKFSPDKVDTMIIQAIALLDELDKELNTYAMRVKEWYGWHFPELFKVLSDNLLYARLVRKMGMRQNAISMDLSDVLDEDLEQEVKKAAEVSMGTEISEEDIGNIMELCDQVNSIAEYRTQLFEYLRNRMNAIAPNLTCMVGELVGARLIAHAGSLMNLAKAPASTVQILGAEKALFRALKTKHDTPKYGLIYHASIVGQAAPKFKGKISRVLAAKCSLSVRMDALGDAEGVTVGLDHRASVEQRLSELEGGKVRALSGTGKGKAAQERATAAANSNTYSDAADVVMSNGDGEKEKKKKKKKDKKKEGEVAPTAAPAAVESATGEKDKKSKKKKRKAEEAAAAAAPVEPAAKKAKKDKKKSKKKAAE